MIRVERLNGDVEFVNPDVVRSVMARPDTVLTFLDGSTMAILGSIDAFLSEWKKSRPIAPKVEEWE